jgi:tripeptidyl-peptidase I
MMHRRSCVYVLACLSCSLLLLLPALALDPSALCCGWKLAAERVGGPATVDFSLVLRERNLAELQALALGVNTPGDALYGDFLTRDGLDRLTAPLPGSMERVAAWLHTHGVAPAQYTVTRGRHVRVKAMPRAQAEALLAADFVTVKRSESERRLFATRYTLPRAISDVVDVVYGLRGVPLPVSQTHLYDETAPEYGPPSVDPRVLKKIYRINATAPGASSTTANKQAIVSFLGQTFSADDTDRFFKTYDSNETTPPPITCVGPADCEGGAETEASLDIQYLVGVSPNAPTEAWYFNGQTLDFCGTVREWTQALLSAKSPPLVSSVSYGFQGNLQESGCTSAGILGVENDLAAAAARGLTIIFASGDAGNGASPQGKLYPSWPGTSPWVTSVGATAFVDWKLYGPQEAAHFTFSSGGGFSWGQDRLPNATWQDDAVQSYFKTASRLPPSAAYRAMGRASPDVSALGQGYMVVQNGRAKPQGGTSAATPTFAGVVSLLNGERLAHGMKPLGMLNPWLYANPGMFTDITVGWDSQNGKSDPSAFPCATGWDPVTGLGTPLYDKMLVAALKAGKQDPGALARQTEDVAFHELSGMSLADIAARVNADPSVTTWTADEPAAAIGASEQRFQTLADVVLTLGTVLETPETHAAHTSRPSEAMLAKMGDPADLPESFDARDAWANCSIIGKVGSQSACGDCWAWSATQAYESVRCIAGKGPDEQLSRQDMAECCSGVACGYSKSCTAGTPRAALGWIAHDDGIVTGGMYNSSEGCKPYSLAPCSVETKAQDPSNPLPTCHEPKPPPSLTCRSSCTNAAFNGTYADAKVGGHDEDLAIVGLYYRDDNQTHMMNFIKTYGPISVAFAVCEDFPTYKTGVYVRSKGAKVLGGHAVTAVGWGVEDGIKYWLVKNSWSDYWGEAGFFKIRRGTNECGIEGQAVGVGWKN